MESSLTPCMKKSSASKTENEEEESGWTSYFEDFFSNQRREQQQSSSSSSIISYHNCKNSHLVSDAASYAHNSNVPSKKSKISSVPKFSKKLNFINNKMRAQEKYYDDSLEDTASSPANSPKVGNLKEMDMNQRKTNDLIRERNRRR